MVMLIQKQHKKHRAPTGARFMAVHLIHDPQDLAEKLFHRLEKSTERFELKLLIIALISRLTGVHQVIIMHQLYNEDQCLSVKNCVYNTYLRSEVYYILPCVWKSGIIYVQS